MYYLYDNSHSTRSKDFEKGLLRGLENIKDAEIFLENVNFSPKEKKIKDRVWNNLARGNAKLEKGELYDGKNSLDLSTKDTEIARIILKEHGRVGRIDSGPVFPEEMRENAEKIQIAQKSSKEVKTKMLARHIAERDILTSRYISNRCKTPRNSFVIMGSSHNLDRLLSQDFSLKTLNKRSKGSNEEARKLAEKMLKNKNML